MTTGTLTFRKAEFLGSDGRKYRVSGSVLFGEVLWLMGPSGCGKSQLLRCLAGLESFLSGEVLLDGKSLVNQSLFERRQGFFFQGGSLFPHLSVLENVCFPLNHFLPYRDWSTALKHERAQNALEQLGAGELVPREIVGLSGGERSRVALAQATVFEPKILFLDEPFAALDEASRNRVAEMLRQQEWMRQTVAFLVSHDADGGSLLSSRRVQWPKGSDVEPGKTIVELEF